MTRCQYFALIKCQKHNFLSHHKNQFSYILVLNYTLRIWNEVNFFTKFSSPCQNLVKNTVKYVFASVIGWNPWNDHISENKESLQKKKRIYISIFLLSIYLSIFFCHSCYYCTIIFALSIITAAPQLCARGPLHYSWDIIYYEFSEFFSERIFVVYCSH